MGKIQVGMFFFLTFMMPVSLAMAASPSLNAIVPDASKLDPGQLSALNGVAQSIAQEAVKKQVQAGVPKDLNTAQLAALQSLAKAGAMDSLLQQAASNGMLTGGDLAPAQLQALQRQAESQVLSLVKSVTPAQLTSLSSAALSAASSAMKSAPGKLDPQQFQALGGIAQAKSFNSVSQQVVRGIRQNSMNGTGFVFPASLTNVQKQAETSARSSLKDMKPAMLMNVSQAAQSAAQSAVKKGAPEKLSPSQLQMLGKIAQAKALGSMAQQVADLPAETSLGSAELQGFQKQAESQSLSLAKNMTPAQLTDLSKAAQSAADTAMKQGERAKRLDPSQLATLRSLAKVGALESLAQQVAGSVPPGGRLSLAELQGLQKNAESQTLSLVKNVSPAQLTDLSKAAQSAAETAMKQGEMAKRLDPSQLATLQRLAKVGALESLAQQVVGNAPPGGSLNLAELQGFQKQAESQALSLVKNVTPAQLTELSKAAQSGALTAVLAQMRSPDLPKLDAGQLSILRKAAESAALDSILADKVVGSALDSGSVSNLSKTASAAAMEVARNADPARLTSLQNAAQSIADDVMKSGGLGALPAAQSGVLQNLARSAALDSLVKSAGVTGSAPISGLQNSAQSSAMNLVKSVNPAQLPALQDLAQSAATTAVSGLRSLDSALKPGPTAIPILKSVTEGAALDSMIGAGGGALSSAVAPSTTELQNVAQNTATNLLQAAQTAPQVVQQTASQTTTAAAGTAASACEVPDPFTGAGSCSCSSWSQTNTSLSRSCESAVGPVMQSFSSSLYAIDGSSQTLVRKPADTTTTNLLDSATNTLNDLTNSGAAR